MPRELLRRLLDQRLGAPGRALLAWRTRGQAEALFEARGLTGPAHELAARLESRVVRGPFAGMRYPRRRGDIVHAAKLLGAYECELHSAIERLIARAPMRVVNVGSGDGYYAVGLARRLPGAHVWAVDPDPIAQRACRETALTHGVSSQLRSVVRVDPAGLHALLASEPSTGIPATGRALCVVDCEGYEDDLLDPHAVPGLTRADLLVESHDFARVGVTERLAARFASTHDVERIAVASRDISAYPELTDLPPAVARGLLDEFRHHPQSWLVLTARTPGTES